MIEDLKKQLTSIRILVMLFIIALSIYLLQIVWQFLSIFADVFILLVSAWLINFILEPLVKFCSKTFKMSIVFSALTIYLIFLFLIGLVIFLFVPVTIIQTQHVITLLPQYLQSYPPFVNKWADMLGSFVNNSPVFIPSVAGFFFYVFLAFIISFYFVIDSKKINQELMQLIPVKLHKEIIFAQELIDTTFASFLRVQLVFALLSGLITWIVLLAFGVEFAATTAFIAGILTIVPVLGPVLAMIPPIIVTLVSRSNQLVFVFIVLLIAQQIIFNVIGPKLLGKAFKIHPVIILLSFVVGYKIAGGVGAIFAIPVLGILVVIVHRLSRHFINPQNI